MPHTKRFDQQISAPVTAGQKDALEYMASERSTTVSQLAREAITLYLNGQTVMISNEVYNQLDAIAAQRGITTMALANNILAEFASRTTVIG